MDIFDNADLEYLVDEDFHGVVSDFEDGVVNTAESDSDFDDDDLETAESNHPKADTTAFEARNGKDIQGIPWEMLNYTRDQYREKRLREYKNFESLFRFKEELHKECLQVEKGRTFYEFQFNTRLVKPTISHFQLRNLIWATSKHDVYFMKNYSLMHWSSIPQRGKEVLNVAKPVIPTMKQPGLLSQPLSRVQISTMAVKDDLIVAGGFQGELVCKKIDEPGVAFCTKLTSAENDITNAVDIYNASSGSMRLITANNDCTVRLFDATNFTFLNSLTFYWPVNNVSASPDGKLMAVLGDSPECLLADTVSGKVIHGLEGHLDYSFSSAWHPNGQILATGNQDTTCRLWDIRNLSQSLKVLKGNMGSIRGLKFTCDGRFLAMAEPADFVHVFDTEADYSKCQEIDLFGEIAGISFSPDTETLFVGVADRTYGSLLEYKRNRNHSYLDSIF
ncbi:unnamed protein product [Cochlearia groenlandica]